MKSKLEVLKLLSPHKKALTIGLFFALFANLFDLVGPFILKLAFDVLEKKQFEWEELFPYAGLLIAFALIRGYFRYQMRMRVVGVSRDIEYDLRTTYFDHLLKLPAIFFDKNRTGDLMNRATSDIENIRMMMGPALMYATNTIVILVIGLAVMFSLSTTLTFYSSIIIPLVVIIVGWLGKEEFKRTDAHQEKLSELSAAVQENLAGIRVIRSYALEVKEIEKMEMHNRELFDKSVKLLRIDMLFTPAMGILFTLGFSIILWKGGILLSEKIITLGTLVAFISYLGLLAWPMIAIGWIANLIQRGLASWLRIKELLNQNIENSSVSNLKISSGEIEFLNVSLSYGDDRPEAIKNISFRIKAGESLGIIGRTGSGKSSLVALIPQLYNITKGEIRIDGSLIQEYSLEELRSAIGFVPQEAFLFSATIAENVRFGGYNASEDELMSAVFRSALINDIDQFEHNFDTMVGERGLTLSGGQKQRTAIARAIITKPKVLILDDPLANVDTLTESKIIESLTDFMKDRTTLLITHRTSTVMSCDHILVLDNGNAVEYGTPKQLLENDSYFRRLLERQRIAEELAEVA